MRAIVLAGGVCIALAAPVPAASEGSHQLVVLIDQASLAPQDCETVARAVGALAAASSDIPPQIVVASGTEVVHPSPTEAAVRGSLCGSNGFLDSPSAVLSAAEAFEILRGNEAVRDAAIRRTCGATAHTACGTGVRASAEALARDLRQRSDDFVRVVERVLREADTPASIVLMSAGPATPELSREILKRVQTAAEARRARSAVLTLASSDRGALARAQRRALGSLRAALDASTLSRLDDNAALSRTVDALLGAAQPRAAEAASRAPAAQPSREDDQIITRAAAHVTEFARQAAVILATEKYEQQVKSRAGSFGLSGSTRMGITRETRTLESEVALVQVLDGSLWLIARDVLAVDGRAVPERGTIAASMATDSIEHAMKLLKATADSGARFNIGEIHRNLNTPTLALLVLTDSYRPHFSFEVGREEHGVRVVTFRERVSPTLLQVNGAPAPSTGLLWIDVQTGAVRRTELVLASQTGQTSRAVVTVDYHYVPGVGAWMPSRMSEHYELPGRRESDWIECTATYSQYRRFTVTTKIR